MPIDDDVAEVDSPILEVPIENEDADVDSQIREVPIDNEDAEVDSQILEVPSENEDAEVDSHMLEVPIDNENPNCEKPMLLEYTPLERPALETANQNTVCEQAPLQFEYTPDEDMHSKPNEGAVVKKRIIKLPAALKSPYFAQVFKEVPRLTLSEKCVTGFIFMDGLDPK